MSPGDSDTLPLSALLSQLLVTYTIEYDNEFERQIAAAGFPAARASLVLWLSVVRFITTDGIEVRELAKKAALPPEAVVHRLACLERWWFLLVDTPNAVSSAHKKRTGWGSGRGIRSSSIVRLSTFGTMAAGIWKSLGAVIDARWHEHFTQSLVEELRETMRRVTRGLGGDRTEAAGDCLATDFLGLLALFAAEFNRRSRVPIDLAANIVRVATVEGVREGDLAALTGGSQETAGVGWQIKSSGLIRLEPDRTRARGKLVRLTPAGERAQRHYVTCTREVEAAWRGTCGDETMADLRLLLERLRVHQIPSGMLGLSQSLVPPAGVVRDGQAAPALGRRDLGAAGRKRARDLAEQTDRFVRNPLGTLPHYPLWDPNRGFGP